jgi:hypothetical protein
VKRFARALAVTVGLLVLGSVISLVPQKNATGAGAAPVFVTNTSVPVSGSVNATVTGTVAVSNLPATQPVSGTVSVGNFPATLTGTSVPVSLKQAANFKTLTLAADLTDYLEVRSDGTVGTSSFAIPQGEQFVITDVSWLTVCGPGCQLSAGDAAPVSIGHFYVSVGTYEARPR